MKDKLITKKVELKPFPVDFCFIGYFNEESFIHYCVNEGIRLDEQSYSGSTDWAYVHSKGSMVFIVFYIPELDNIGTIAHEAIHALDKMFQIIGQPEHTITGDELIPYYTGFIVNEILSFLVENKILSLIFNNQQNEK